MNILSYPLTDKETEAKLRKILEVILFSPMLDAEVNDAGEI